MSASPTAPCVVAADGTDSAGRDLSTAYTIKATQSINVTTAPPASKQGGESFPVAATASSGLSVSVSVSGNCSYAAPNVTMTKTTGTCTVKFNQAGDATWVAAPEKSYTVTATGLPQTITVTTPAPASADYNSSFMVAATTNAGRAVAITTSGSCSGSGSGSATITMTSGTGVCTVKYNQTDNTPPYAPAAEVTSSTTANKLAQTITFPDQTTPSRVFVLNNTFAINPLASASSGLGINYSSLDTGKCTVSGTTVTMKGGGNCVIAADQPGNANYDAASRMTQIVRLTRQPQSITVTQHAPGIKSKNQSFTVKATASSGLAVSINGMGNCSGSGTGAGTTITMGSGSGLCSVVYSQPGDSSYEPADPVTEHVAVDDGGSGCFGEGTYTSLRFDNTGGYIGWACNGGDYIAPGHSISCSPDTYWPWPGSRWGWSIKPGIGFKGHVLQTQLNPGKTFKIQRAPGAGEYYNILNMTDATCLASGNGVYEAWAPRLGSNSSAGYLVAIQDSSTMPSGRYCDYGSAQTKWKINYGSGYATFETAGYPSWPQAGCIGSDSSLALSRLLLEPGRGNFGHWGDTWVRNALPSCSSGGAKIKCEGYTPAPPDHIRFEFNADAAYTCPGQGTEVTIKVCKNAMPGIGSAGSCDVFDGYAALRPQASRGAWMGLTADPSTTFNGKSTGISLLHTVVGESVNLSYSNPSLTLANSTLECYDTKSNKRVSCTAAFTYKECPPFDAMEKGAELGANLYTKLAGVPFEFDVATGNTAFTGNVTVELVDVSGGAAVCPDTGAKLTGVSFTLPAAAANSITHAYVAGDNGRKTFEAKFDNAVAKVQVRIKDKDNNCYASSDSFTIRPTWLELAMTPDSGTWPAGEALTMTATAKNSAGATTTGYTGTPVIVDKEPILITDWRNVSISSGDFHGDFGAAVAGVASGVNFGYEGVGELNFQLATGSGSAVGDSTYTGGDSEGDQSSGDCVEDSYSNDVADDPGARGRYGCNIGSRAMATTPRFTPHHYDVSFAFYPAHNKDVACDEPVLPDNPPPDHNPPPSHASGAFSYFGQLPASAPIAVVWAMSKSCPNNKCIIVRNLFDEYTYKPSFVIEQYNGVVKLTTSLMDLTPLPTASGWPSKDSGADGGKYANSASGVVARPTVTKPAAPPSYEHFNLKATITDTDGIKVGNCNGDDVSAAASSDCVSTQTRLRFGVLKLDNAYGSELLPLFVPVTALYWDGAKWVRNTEDKCTTLTTATTDPARAVAVGNYKANLGAAQIAISAASTRLNEGQASIRFESPGAGVHGSADVALNLNPPATSADSSCLTWGTGAQAANVTAGAGLDYLRGAWCGNVYDKDPHARITFGTPKSQFLYMRERY